MDDLHSFPSPPCAVGDRIHLVRMAADDPCPVPPGTAGTVRAVDPWADGTVQVSVDWDASRSLALIWPRDVFEVIADRGEGG